MYGTISRSQLRIKQPSNFALSSLHLLSALLTLKENSTSDISTACTDREFFSFCRNQLLYQKLTAIFK